MGGVEAMGGVEPHSSDVASTRRPSSGDLHGRCATGPCLASSLAANEAHNDEANGRDDAPPCAKLSRQRVGRRWSSWPKEKER